MQSTSGVRLRASLVALAATAVSGCAGVNFYSDASLASRTGIPIYGAKPYVMVVRSQSKDKPIEVTIQYITDRSQVIYAEPRSGFGSADLKLTLDHGQLTQFGQITDTKIPELINAVSGLLTSRATAIKTLAEADQLKAKTGAGTTQAAKVPDKETSEKIVNLSKDMAQPQATADIATLDASERKVVNDVRQALGSLADAIGQPQKVNLLPDLGDEVIKASKAFSALPAAGAAASARTTALQRIGDWKTRLADIVTNLTPDQVSGDADFELYEIVQDKGGISLRPVK